MKKKFFCEKKVYLINDLDQDCSTKKYKLFNSTLLNFGKRYEDDLKVIFDQWHQWPKLHISLDAISNQKILKGIYYLYFDRDRMSGFEWYGLSKRCWNQAAPLKTGRTRE